MINLTPIYDRHPGPYAILLLLEDDKGKLSSKSAMGTTSPVTTHDRAMELLEEKNVVCVSVFEAGGQFTGAFYRKGEEYTPLDYGRVPERAVVPEGGTAAPVDVAAPPKVQRAKTPGSRFPAMRGQGLELTPGMDDQWPKSAPAQMVRSHFEFKGAGFSATAPELVADIGPALKEIGVEFPASLISRLKQKGLLRKVSYEQEVPQGDAPEQEAEPGS